VSSCQRSLPLSSDTTETSKGYGDGAALTSTAGILAAGLPATFLRPWYVLGPGHRWPYALLPFYALLERLPATRDTARRLGLVTLRQMIAALVRAVESSPEGVRIFDVEEIRRAA
jgi:uncharacterized protein YbjT (DUF2867 family)